MMILMERFLGVKNGVVADSRAHSSWHSALRILKCYGVLTDSATRCVAVLEILVEKLFLNEKDTAHVTQSGDIDINWDSLWAISTPLGEDLSLSDLSTFPFNFEDFILTDAS